MMKRILGLDLGTNSIGWALIQQDFENKQGEILGMGSRIIPMDQGTLGDFGKGIGVSQTADRTRFRSIRRLRERYLLRRQRLHRILNVLGFLPKHYAEQIDFENRLGQFLVGKEPKLAYQSVWNDNKEKMEFEFIFKESFEEMLEDFRLHQPQILVNRKGEHALIPYDWTIYFLRKKALKQKLTKEELSWIILNFNQKRGYYQLRGEEEESLKSVNEYVINLKVVQIEKGEVDRKNDKRHWYNVTLENGWIYTATFTAEPQWLGIEKEFLITEELDEEGNIKIVKDRRTDTDGKEKRKITPLPSFEEIDLMTKTEQDKIYKKIKAKTEITISNSGKTVGSYIYDTLLQNPKQKIKGKLVRTIERKFYKEELIAILKKQMELQPELFSDDLYTDCIRELYRTNEDYRISLSKRDFVHLFVDDLIFYQRPLRSQKSSISNCPLEFRAYKIKKKDERGNLVKDENENDIYELDENGKPKIKKEYLKAIPKSNPLYQEFRIWQWLYNLKIFRKEDDVDVTNEFVRSIDDYERLFAFLMGQKEVNHRDILNHFIVPVLQEKFPGAKTTALKKEIEKEIAKYRWNYVFDDTKEKEDEKSKKYPMNETAYLIRKRLEKVEGIAENSLSTEIEYKLWHIIYSVTDKVEYEKALKGFAQKNNLDETSFIGSFKSFPPFKSDYGSFSEKAIKKLLPLMRNGKYWKWEDIDTKTQNRISKLLTGEFDETIKNRVREKAEKLQLQTEMDFRGLPLWLAQYVVYDRHSEAEITGKWDSVNDLEEYIEDFKQHSLRNPIVEQVVTETLRVVRDIWKKYGNGEKDFLNEIHIELGRDLKNNTERRRQFANLVSDNEAANLRIKELLIELKENSDGKLYVEDVRPYSPKQQEALKIFEDGALSTDNVPEDVLKISKTAQPSKSELQRYKLWLQQNYRSPYTGNPIPLSKLFTHEYEVEHVIPQARFFDDGFSNKIICESAINKLKDKQLGLQFIKSHAGEIVQDGSKQFKIFTETEYRDFVKNNYAKNSSKRKKLLMEEIPDKMIERQLNDTRYISKFVVNVLSNIVRADDGKDEEYNSKNVLPGNGKITSALRQDWGLNDVWNELILSRFERMNLLTNSTVFTVWNDNYQKYLPTVPLEYAKGFSKKRIDHRHHALDALVIACATREHIQYLNNENAKSQKRHLQIGLAKKLRKMETIEVKRWKQDVNGVWKKSDETIRKEVPKDYIKPWETFTIDAKNALEKIVPSFKQNLRVINKTVNKYEKYVEKNGKLVKERVPQIKGDSWAIRKPMHEETVSGHVDLKWIKLGKGEIAAATRKSIDKSFGLEKIQKITDTGIQKILENYLKYRDNNPELAFSPEGLEELNRNITQFNKGKYHQPIFKVRLYEKGKGRFTLGQNGNKNQKFVQGAPNLFFAVYENKETKKRMFDIAPLNEVIEHQKLQESLGIPKAQRTSIPLKNILEERGKEVEVNFLFSLSPNDLVYMPKIDEIVNEIDFTHLTNERLRRIFMVNDFSATCYFSPNSLAKNIAPKEVDLNFDQKKNKLTGSFDTKTASFEGRQIKDYCIKLKIDRLGNISKA